jgi:hypothetical protein
MGLITRKDDTHSPPLFKTFSNPTADQNLHTEGAGGAAGAAPTGINHLPCSIFVRAEAGTILHLEDIAGEVNSHTFVAAFYGSIRCAPAVLGDETTCAVTVFWQK